LTHASHFRSAASDAGSRGNLYRENPVQYGPPDHYRIDPVVLFDYRRVTLNGYGMGHRTV